MTVVKLPKMEKYEIEKLLQEQMLCRIAFKGDKYPYMAPFQYVLMDGFLYFHFTDYGKKMRLLERDKRVCVEIEKYRPDLSEYNFVVLRGELEVVRDPNERAKVINRIAEEGKQKLSTNFLAAHGFKKEEGWSSFAPERQVVIVKLKEVAEEIGLKSPE
ncbi:MAG: pyridoxamine 5'-phosphate oxidase family protein [Candidatus Bathyarchaeota archaeon]|nr:pyridoxamine 5'-phosphate oxidase family protein [Candidatus Bathyarchaeota archaeon]MDH5494974.1 pyridoxamine 5'-phosphate oxidase family protein [Candidatus Bathyarchaeota archaeon]